jgi:outer membrane protein
MSLLPRLLLPCLALAALPRAANAEEGGPDEGEPAGRPVSLGEALALAHERSPALARARIDVAVADAAVLEAAGIEDWVVSAGGNVLFQRREVVQGDVVGTGKVNRFSLEGALSRLLPTGGRVQVSARGVRDQSLFALVGQERTEHSAALTFSLIQPLLAGLGATVTRAPIPRAGYARDAASLAHESVARDAVRRVVESYWRLVLARHTLEIREASLDLAREQLRRTRAGIEIGSVAPTEALAVEQVIASREEEILVARLAISERSLELRQLVGMRIAPGEIDLAPTAPLLVEPRPMRVDALLPRAFEASPELAELRVRGERATLEVEVTDSGVLPRLDLSVSGGPIGVDETFAGSLESLARLSGWFVSGGLSFEQPIGRRQARGAQARAYQERRRIVVDAADVEAQIAVALVRAAHAAEVAHKRMEITQRVVELSQQNIQAEQGRFELGRATNFDVLTRQGELEQARLRLAQASVDYLLAVAAIDTLTGEILPRYGVTLDPAPRPAP